MKRMPWLRNSVFMIMLVAGLAASGNTVFASLSGFCSNWDFGFVCDCTGDDYDMSGWCDFSEESNPLELGDDYCNGAFWECVDTCEGDDYVDYLIGEHCPFFDPEDPACYEECWVGYAGFSCTAGANSEFECGCNSFNWCE